MFNNYEYFITLAEEENISRAAEKLFISHQCLSKYLKNLEESYHVMFFDRTPKLKLTPAGQAMLETLRQVQFLDRNLDSQLQDIRNAQKGTVRLGITEGRYSLLIPDLLTQFRHMYPDVLLDVHYSDSHQLSEQVLKNELDLAIMNRSDFNHSQLEFRTLLEENLFLVISDNMLAQYFPDRYPECREDFRKGVDLAKFSQVPFVMLHRGFNSREVLEEYQRSRGLHLNCVLELQRPDLHFMLTARDYAASFCWSMYTTLIRQSNADRMMSHLNIFPIRGLKKKNSVVLITAKGKILPAYGKDLIRLIKSDCSMFSDPERNMEII